MVEVVKSTANSLIGSEWLGGRLLLFLVELELPQPVTATAELLLQASHSLGCDAGDTHALEGLGTETPLSACEGSRFLWLWSRDELLGGLCVLLGCDQPLGRREPAGCGRHAREGREEPRLLRRQRG